jgi:hypothetical protein
MSGPRGRCAGRRAGHDRAGGYRSRFAAGDAAARRIGRLGAASVFGEPTRVAPRTGLAKAMPKPAPAAATRDCVFVSARNVLSRCAASVRSSTFRGSFVIDVVGRDWGGCVRQRQKIECTTERR